MPMLTLNDAEIYYEVHGKGPPLCLIAGLASDSQSWLPIRDILAEEYQLIMFDNRGVGRTNSYDDNIKISTMADDCIELLNYLGLQSVHLLGHSMGGFIAQECALRYPERIDSLILAASASSNSQRNNHLFADWADSLTKANGEKDLIAWFRNLFYWIFSRKFFENKQIVDEALSAAVNYPYQQGANSFRKQVEAIATYDCAAKLSKIRARCLLMMGQDDLIFPIKKIEENASKIVKVSQLIIPDAAHAIHFEKPHHFIEGLRSFLTAG